MFYSTPFLSLLLTLLIFISLPGCATHYKQVSLQEDYLKPVDTIKFCLSCHDKEQDRTGTNPPYVKNSPVMLAGGDFAFVEKTGHGFSCLSCHTPHASGNYRNLKTEINKKPIIVKAEGDRIKNRYISGMNNFCLSCHVEFLPKATKSPYEMHSVGVRIKGLRSVGNDKSDNLTIRIEESDGEKTVFCLSCHYAHAGPYFKAMLWDNLKEYTLCLECHPR